MEGSIQPVAKKSHIEIIVILVIITIIATIFSFYTFVWMHGDAVLPAKPSTPLNLTAVQNNGAVNLTWQQPSNNGGTDIIGFNLYRNGSLLLQLANVYAFSDEDVVVGATYTYEVGAMNSVGEGAKSATANVTIAPIITVPNSAPTADKPWMWSDSFGWHIQQNATDDDGTVHYIYVRIYDYDSNSSIWDGRKDINAKTGSYTLDISYLPAGSFGIETITADNDGAITKKYDSFSIAILY